MGRKIFIVLGAFLLGMMGGFFLWHDGGRRGVVADTVRTVVTDTVRYYEPVARDSVVVKYVTRVLPAKTDTSSVKIYAQEIAENIRDSMEVKLPISQKTYESEDYKAWVSGYEARLDSLRLYRKFETQEVSVMRKTRVPRLVLGLSVGAGYGIVHRQADIYLGVSACYRLWP